MEANQASGQQQGSPNFCQIKMDISPGSKLNGTCIWGSAFVINDYFFSGFVSHGDEAK